MITITPNYYKDFKCIANKCKHSCCIGWEIDIDDVTLQKYNNLKGNFASKLKSNIEFDDTPHFILDANERCPFLNNQGLCDIIINLGEVALCQICSDHPRFRNYYDNFTEIGLGIACEAAAEIILTKTEKTELSLPPKTLNNPIINFRQKLFDIMQNRTLAIDKRIENMLNVVGVRFPADINWYAVFDSLEKMDSNWDTYLLRIKDGIDSPTTDSSLDTAYEQLLIYLIFRHFSDCQYDDKINERILFAVLIYKVIKTMNTSNTIDELLEIARLYSCEIEYSDENINTLLSKLS